MRTRRRRGPPRLRSALRELRRRAGLTQEQLSGRVGVTVEYLSRLENGRRGARWHTVMRLLRALDATLTDLGAAIERMRTPPKK